MTAVTVTRANTAVTVERTATSVVVRRTELIVPGADDQTAAQVPFTPAGGLASTDVQAALAELDTEKATPAQVATAVAGEATARGEAIETHRADTTNVHGFADTATLVRLAETTVMPEAYGAVGDELTDDTDAILEAIATGANVKLNPGSVYSVRGGMELIDWQDFDLNGATIKRLDQAGSTTDTDVGPMVTTYVLADASDFTVGMHVAFANSTVARSALVGGTSVSDNNPKITAINGNTITLDQGPNVLFSAQALVYSAGQTFIHGNCSRLHGGVIDGNKANYAWTHWGTIGEVYNEGSRVMPVTEDIQFVDLPGEGYQMRGDYPLIRHCSFDQVNGNPIHMAAATHPVIDDIDSRDCNLDTSMGHVTGHITFSSTISDAIVTRIRTVGGRSGIGGLSENDGEHIFSDIIIREATTYGLDLDGTTGHLIFNNVQVYDSGAAGATDGGCYIARNTGPVEINGLQLYGCDLKLNDCDGVYVDVLLAEGSRVNSTLLDNAGVRVRTDRNIPTAHVVDISGGTAVMWDVEIDLTGDTLATGIKAGACTDYTFVGWVKGGATGMTATNVNNVNLVVDGMEFSGQLTRGLNVGSATGTYRLYDVRAICTAAGVSWTGINVNGLGVTAEGVKVHQLAGSASYGIRILAQCTMIRPLVTGTYGSKAFQITAGSTNSVVMNAVTPTAIQDLGTTTQQDGNRVLGGVSSATGKAIGVLTSATVSTATASLDISAADEIDLTLSHAAPTITLANIVAGDGAGVTQRQDSTGSRIPVYVHATLPVKWANGVVPTFSAIPNSYDRLAFVNTGSEITATLIGKGFA